MSVHLLIRDGTPEWYLSPDIWVVPGTDPDGAPGAPLAGAPAYLWARVQNTGTTTASNVRLDYYWADPTLQVTRSNAHFVGSAFATIPAGDTREVLCLVPWVPVVVNGGHECVVVVANHQADPLPNPLPDAFDPPTYDQIAQKNLTVLAMVAMVQMELITVAALHRVDKQVVLTAQVGGDLDQETLAGLGLRGMRPASRRAVEVGLRRERGCPDEDEPLGARKLALTVPRGTSTGVNVVVRSHGLEPDEYALVHVTEHSGDKLLGGIVFVAVAPQNGKEYAA